MSMAPVWGFQLLIAIAISIWFRLNKVLVLLAANFSIPPLIPVILYISHEIGAIWVGENSKPMSFSSDISYDMLSDGLLQYFLGAVTLSAGSGVVTGMMTYFLLTFYRRKSNRNTGD